MQYLAELQKQAAFIGGSKASVRLLARNAGENNWQNINNEQILPVTDGSQAQDLKDGQLVIAEVNSNNQVQSVQDATKRLVSILQTFSRTQEKFRTAEEDVEQWRQSLNFQSQELHRRERELEQKELEFEHLDIRRQEVEEAEAKLSQQRAELEVWRAQIDSQKEQLAAQSSAISASQAQHLQELVQKLVAGASTRPQDFSVGLAGAMQIINERQEVLNGFWQKLEPLKQEAQKQQQSWQQGASELSQRKAQWQQSQTTLADAQAELKAQRGILKLQESNMAMTRLQLQAQQELYEQTSNIVESLGGSASEGLSAEEIQRLEQIPLDELEKMVGDCQGEFDRLTNYLSAQEDELAGLEGEIADLQSQIVQAADQFARIELENNKEFAEEQYKLLEESVSGMRQGMKDREAILKQQRNILDVRRGGRSEANPLKLLVPLLGQIEAQKVRHEQELKKMESQIDAVKNYMQQQQDLLSRQLQEHQQQQQEIQAAEEQLNDRLRLCAELVGQIKAQEALLRPAQDVLDNLRPHIEKMIAQTNTANGSTNDANQLVAQLQQAIQELVPA
ncbi:MAG: pilus motility taxis protein HmpF [Pseudanabaenaceae cyanobacterium]